MVADRLVLSKVRALLGGRIRFLISGSATLSTDVARWFHAAGVLVLEGYALTETSSGACIALPHDPAFGTVGPPVVGTELRIAPDGEIHVRGPGVMRGYHNLPEETAEVLDEDGWFATGDIGEIDDRGRLRITDRKKDLIKTSGGKYIAPQAIEVDLQGGLPARQPDAGARRRPQLRDRAGHPRRGRARPSGPRRTGCSGDYATLAAAPGRARLRGELRRWS